MNTYKYTPQKMIKNAVILSGICIFGAALLLLSSPFVGTYRGIILCVVFMTIAIQITTRFILSSYTFILDDINFIIVRTYGGKSQQVCNIKLNTAVGISDKKSSKEIEKEFGKIIIRKNFCQNLWASEEYTYVFEFDEKKSAVRFDADVNFINEMKLRIKEANLRYGE